MTPPDFRRAFTEAADEETIRSHAQHAVIYGFALRRAAAELDCEPTEEGVLRARANANPAIYTNRLLEKTKTGLMILDHGFAGGEAMSPSEHTAAIKIPQRRVLRLETAAERLVASSHDLDEWLAAVQSAIRSAIGEGAVGIKTIAAYRAGLRLAQPDRGVAERAFTELRARATSQDSIRLEGEPLCHTLLLAAAETCRDLGVPLQVHCGFGDPDEDMALTSPLGLRRLFTESRYAGLRVALLHCYPYHREAAYLAAMFPGVYMDLSLTIPYAAHDGARALNEALGLCPTSKLLYATDATRYAEVYLVAAELHREALAAALAQLVDGGWMTQQEAVDAGRRVLETNARSLYGLD